MQYSFGRLSDFSDSKEERMEVFCGLSLTPSQPPVVGRLISSKMKGMPSARGACISVCSYEEDGALSECEGEGILVVGSASWDPSMLRHSNQPILAIPALAERCMGKIAVLDPSLGKLFVSPDLETVAYYSARLGTVIGDLSKPITACADAKILSICRTSGGQMDFCESGWVLDLRNRIDTEEHVYEQCCDLAELAVGQGVTVVLDLGARTHSQEELRACLKGVFRAAIYGSFSLLIGGCLSERDTQRCRGMLHRSFCELSSEGREFNGYIPKGLLMDNLLYPLSGGSWDGLDFCCMDVVKLSQSLTGLKWNELSARLSEWETIGESLASVLRTRGALPLWGWFPEEIPPRALCRCLIRAGMETWIFEKGYSVEALRYLREIWENRQLP